MVNMVTLNNVLFSKQSQVPQLTGNNIFKSGASLFGGTSTFGGPSLYDFQKTSNPFTPKIERIVEDSEEDNTVEKASVNGEIDDTKSAMSTSENYFQEFSSIPQPLMPNKFLPKQKPKTPGQYKYKKLFNVLLVFLISRNSSRS